MIEKKKKNEANILVIWNYNCSTSKKEKGRERRDTLVFFFDTMK